MQFLKKWGLPFLTVLVALTASILPPQLSRLGDGRLIGKVHTEELTADSEFPVHTSSLEQRINLMLRWSSNPDGLTIYTQTLFAQTEETEKLLVRVQEECKSMVEDGILSEELLPVEEMPLAAGDLLAVERVFVRDGETGVAASFLSFDCYYEDKPFFLHMGGALDEESGHILRLELHFSSHLGKFPIPLAEEVGAWFLTRLGLEFTVSESGRQESIYFLPDAGVYYSAGLNKNQISIGPLAGGADSNVVDVVYGVGNEQKCW